MAFRDFLTPVTHGHSRLGSGHDPIGLATSVGRHLSRSSGKRAIKSTLRTSSRRLAHGTVPKRGSLLSTIRNSGRTFVRDAVHSFITSMGMRTGRGLAAAVSEKIAKSAFAQRHPILQRIHSETHRENRARQRAAQRASIHAAGKAAKAAAKGGGGGGGIRRDQAGSFA